MHFKVLVDKLFQVFSLIAFTGFLVLFAQVLHSIYKKRKKRQAKVDAPVALSAVTSDVGPRKPECAPDAPVAKSPEPAEKRPDSSGTKLLHDKMDALLSRIRDLRCTDTTPEIYNVICAYLFAAEDLLRLRRAGPGGGGWMTNAELNAAADAVVRETTDAVKSLQTIADRKETIVDRKETLADRKETLADRKESVRQNVQAIIVVASISLSAAAFAMVFAQDFEEQVVLMGKHIDLTRFTLHGESRAAGACACGAALLAPAIQATLRALADISKSISEGTGLIFALILYPADAAFRCLVSTLLLLGLPLGIKAVGALSMLCILGMAMLAGACSAQGHELEGKSDVAGGQSGRNKTWADDDTNLNNVGSKDSPKGL